MKKANNAKTPRFSLMDEAAAQELLANDGFRQAFQASMRLLGCCFLYAPDHPDAARALDALRSMNIEQDWPFGESDDFRQAAFLLEGSAEDDAQELKEEFACLFRGPGHLDAPPWGSVYLDRDQVTFGCTWLELRDWMRANGVQSLYEEKEPEDQFGRMLLLAAQVCKERPELLPELLGNHLLTWAYHYLTLFMEHGGTRTYCGLGLLAQETLRDVQDLLGIVPAKRRFYR